MILDGLVLHPTDHGCAERCFTGDVEHPKALLPERDDVAASILCGLVLEYFCAASDLGHVAGLGIDSHDSKTFVSLQYGLEQHPITGFKNVEWQQLLWKQHDVRQGEQGKLPDGKIEHGRRAKCLRILGRRI